VTATPCGAGNIYSGGLKASTTSAVFTDGEGKTFSKCTGSTLGGKIEQAGGAGKPVVVGTNYLDFTGCSTKTWVIKNSATLNIEHKAGTDNGTIKGKGALTVTLNIGLNECAFELGPFLLEFGTFTGGAPAATDVDAELAYISGGALCPEDVIWEGTYSVTEPSNSTLHVQAE
jgi:hypothetical protein